MQYPLDYFNFITQFCILDHTSRFAYLDSPNLNSASWMFHFEEFLHISILNSLQSYLSVYLKNLDTLHKLHVSRLCIPDSSGNRKPLTENATFWHHPHCDPSSDAASTPSRPTTHAVSLAIHQACVIHTVYQSLYPFSISASLYDRFLSVIIRYDQVASQVVTLLKCSQGCLSSFMISTIRKKRLGKIRILHSRP